MPRLVNKLSRYSLHKPSGLAKVKFQGKVTYLGRHSSPESHAAYAAFVAKLPKPEDPTMPPEHAPGAILLVGEIVHDLARSARRFLSFYGFESDENRKQLVEALGPPFIIFRDKVLDELKVSDEPKEKLLQHMMEQISQIPGTTDLRIQQPFNLPSWTVNVDRTRAQQVGYSQRDVANSVLTSLSGSFQTSPTFYLNPQNHVSYNIAVQTPQYDVQNLQQLQNFPIATNGSGQQPQILGNIASIDRGVEQGTVSHYNARSVIDIYGSVEGTDLASVAAKIEQIVKDNNSKLPRGSEIFVRGQVQTMHTSFVGLVSGLLFSIILVYALIVVNFQSWLDPFIILTALPGALAGILWMLFLTQTTISVPALMGSIMCIGVATSNSILMITFANDEREAGHAAKSAVVAAGSARRPSARTAACCTSTGAFGSSRRPSRAMSFARPAGSWPARCRSERLPACSPR